MSSAWGPSDQELTNTATYQFSANWDASPQVDQLGDGDDCESNESEGEDDEEMSAGHLLDLAEAAHLVDVYHMDKDIALLLDSFTLHDTSTRNNAQRKRKHS